MANNINGVNKRKITKKERMRRQKIKRRRILIKRMEAVLITVAIIFLTIVVVKTIKGDKKDDEGKESNSVQITTFSSKETNNDKNNTENQTTEELTEETTELAMNIDGFTVSNEIVALPTDIISLGYNPDTTERDELNRPLYIDGIQNKYGNYNAEFIGDKEGKKIYITFTIAYERVVDGINNTDKIMEILKEKNVPAVFFVNGEYTERFPEMCKKIVDNGFTIGCHAYKHPSEGVASLDIQSQVEDAKMIYNAIYNLTGVKPYLYRHDSGIWNERSLALLQGMGFKSVLYSFTYYDFDVNNQPDEKEALDKFIRNLHSGEIMYLHTVSDTNVAILGEFIDKSRQMGYTFEVVK